MTRLEEEILHILEEEMCSEYTGHLKVIHEDGLYDLCLYMNRELSPRHFIYEGDVSEFKKFLRKEFHQMSLTDVTYWKTLREGIDKSQFINVLDLNEYYTRNRENQCCD